MKKIPFRKRILSGALVLITVLSVVLPSFSVASGAAGVNGGIPADKIIGGTDFSEFFNTKSIGGEPGSTAFENDSGKEYLRFDHGQNTVFNVLADGGEFYISAQYNSVSGSGIFVPLTGAVEKDITVSVTSRYEDLGSESGLSLITLRGKNAYGDVYFTPVKLSATGDILICNGNGYSDSGIDLTAYQWKDISVSFHMIGTSVKADIYISETLRAENVLLPVQFSSFTGIETLYPLDGNSLCKAEIRDIWIINSAVPAYGTASGADAETVTALLDIDSLEDGKTYYETYAGEGFTLKPFGNPFQVLTAGANKYISASHVEYQPYAEMESVKPTVGKGQVIEISLKTGSGWNGSAELLCPYYEDSSGVVHRIEMLTLQSNGNVILTKTGELLGSVGSDDYSVISVAVSFDRKYADIYIDGRIVLSGAEYTDVSYSRIDGVRVFWFPESDVSSGTLYTDYALMYSGVIPTNMDETTELYFENTFNSSASAADYAPLRFNGNAIVLEAGASGYRLGYRAGVTGQSSVSLETVKSKTPMYVEFAFSYTELLTDVALVTLSSGGGDGYVAAGIGKDGRIYAMSDGEKRVGQTLMSGKTYLITVVADPENRSCGLYIDGQPELIYSLLPEGTDGFDSVELISMNADGRSKVILDDLVVYSSYRKIGMPLKEIAFDFSLEVSGLGDIIISWESAGPAAKYTVWRSNLEHSPQEQICAATSNLSFTDINVTEDATYYYAVYLTTLLDGEEQYMGFGTGIRSIKAELPPEPAKPATPVGQLPDYVSVLKLSEDFSDENTQLKLNSDKCFIEMTTGLMKILNTAESYEIPYFAVNDVKTRKALIFDFELNISKNDGIVNLASVYNGSSRVTDLLRLNGYVLSAVDGGAKLCTLKAGSTNRITLWIDAGCSAAAVFVNGACVSEYIDIPKFDGNDKACSVRFCQVIGAATLTVDNFSMYETRAFISDYTANQMSPIAVASGNDNKVSWTKAEGCLYYTVWASGSPNGGFSIAADKLESWQWIDENVSENRYYKVTYTFDTLGMELTVPLSSVANCERKSTVADVSEIPEFIDLSSKESVSILVISAVAILCIVITFVKKRPSRNSPDSGDDML